ncbi:MAG: hypothetical protein JO053_14790 [Acidobacteria bacterium]|nr:hypothetical protein [Acidobacteriota bacterium]
MERNNEADHFEHLEWNEKANRQQEVSDDDVIGNDAEASAHSGHSKLLESAISDLLRTIDICIQQRGLRAEHIGNDLSLDEKVRKYETGLIIEALVETGGHQRRASELLGIKNTTLNEKMRRLGIPSPKQRRTPSKT